VTTVRSPEDRQRDNFNHWKGVVGLPQSFPKLSILKDSELEPEIGFYQGVKHEPVIRSVLESVTNARIAVILDVGHGCTTLSRYILKKSVEDAVRTRTISVHLSVDDFDVDVTDYGSIVFDRCRDAIVSSLVLAPWQRPLKRAIYASLIGAPGQTEEILEPQRMRLASLLGLQLHRFDLGDGPIIVAPQREVEWDDVREVAPRLAVEPQELIYDISHGEGIEISLQIDLSSNRYKDDDNRYTDDYYDVVARLSSAVKAVHEQEAADLRRSAVKSDSSRSMLGIMLFTSDDGLEAFTAEWDQEFDRVEYPMYGPPDVFAILAYHYPQRVAASGIVRTQAMIAIMSDQFVTNVYDRDKSLHGIMEALERGMLAQFDDWANARIRLEAPEGREKQEDPEEEDSGEEEA
jgi:hypothetical protein